MQISAHQKVASTSRGAVRASRASCVRVFAAQQARPIADTSRRNVLLAGTFAAVPTRVACRHGLTEFPKLAQVAWQRQ
jgi:hypothetical protein